MPLKGKFKVLSERLTLSKILLLLRRVNCFGPGNFQFLTVFNIGCIITIFLKIDKFLSTSTGDSINKNTFK